MGSFRLALALRVALLALAVAVVSLLAAAWFLRSQLVSQIDAGLLAVARVESEFGLGRGGASPGPAAHPLAARAIPVWIQLLAHAGHVKARSSNLRGFVPVPPAALGAAIRGEVAFTSHPWDSESVRSAFYPVPGPGGSSGNLVLQVSTSLAPVQSALDRFVWLMGLLALVGSGLAGLAGWEMAGRALSPALALTTEAESIGVNELGRRVALPGGLVEFNGMAAAFNALLSRLEQAVTGTRRFTADASHELRAPLTVLRGEIELALSRARTPEEYQEVLRRCLDEVLRLVRLVDDLLTLTRIQGGVVGGARQPVELDDVAERAVQRKSGLARSRGVAIDLEGTAGLVLADAELLLRALDGLLEHAVMASPAGGRVRVHLASDQRHSVEVTDGGSGLKADEISGVFQRFYRSNRPRVRSEESGLGLPIARAVALSHGGALEYVGNNPGASFKLSLPVLPTALGHGERAAEAPA